MLADYLFVIGDEDPESPTVMSKFCNCVVKGWEEQNWHFKKKGEKNDVLVGK